MPKSCTAWGKAIHERDKVCQVHKAALANGLFDVKYMCKGPLEADHLISKKVERFRNELENGMLLCAWHHRLSPEISHHTAPVAFWGFLQVYMPEKYEFRQMYKNKVFKYGREV